MQIKDECLKEDKESWRRLYYMTHLETAFHNYELQLVITRF
jgi:hypothetical protein